MAKPIVALVDADIVAYKFAAQGQQLFKWEDGVETLFVDDPLDVADQVDMYLDDLRAKLNADRMICYLSCPSDFNWRLKILPTYKGNRKDLVKPVLLSKMRNHILVSHESYIWDNLEADDVLGILATCPTYRKDYTKIIVSEDKDLRQIPALLFNPRKDDKPKKQDPWLCDVWHMTQVLTGDRTDNYMGCPGIGDVKAKKILDGATDLKDMWSRVVTAYEAKGLTEADALVQAQVSRICQNQDYNFDTKEVIPWNPPV
jgi:DNA polymerase-1